MRRIDGKGKRGGFVKGGKSNDHNHKDGTRGHDIEAYKEVYKDGKKVSKVKLKNWGKMHTSTNTIKRRIEHGIL